MKLTRPFKAGAAAAALAAALVLTACGGGDAGSGSGTDADVTVKVGTLRGQPHLYQPYFYQSHAPAGVKFEIVQFDSSPDIVTAVAGGAVDIGIAGVPAALSAVANGKDVKVVASAADGGSGFVGDASVKSIQGLAGKNVGYPQGASQEVLLRLTLKKVGIDIKKLKLVNLPFSDMASALKSGRISAFLSAEMGPSTAIQAGAHVIASPYDTEVGKVNIGLIVGGETIAQDAKLVQKVVDAHKAAVSYMDAHHDEWAAGLVKDFGVDKDVVATAIKNIWLRSDLDREYQDQVIALAGQMHGLGALPSVPTVDAVFDTSFIG